MLVSRLNLMFKERFFYPIAAMYVDLILVVLFLSGANVAFKSKLTIRGEWGEPATILGHLIPNLIDSQVLYGWSQIIFYISGLLWISRRLPIISPIICSLAYLLITSMLFESSPNAEKHSVHMLPNLFLILAAYDLFFFSELKASRKNWQLYQQESHLPGWILELFVFTIGICHSWAGISKLLESGLSWVNGTSLQIWVKLWGGENLLNNAVLNSFTFAWFSQAAVLIIETLAIFVFIDKKRRLYWGGLIVVFHLVNEYMWGWMFLHWCPIIFLSSSYALYQKRILKT